MAGKDNNAVQTQVDAHTVEYRGRAARNRARQVLMEMTGKDNARDAEAVMLGRPTLGDGASVQLHFKAPQEMAEFVDEQRKRSGMHNKSEYLRMLVEREMENQEHRLQDV